MLIQIVPSIDYNEISRLLDQDSFKDVTFRIFDEDEKDEKTELQFISKDQINNSSTYITCERTKSELSFRELRAHKVILVAHSNVFATMFSSKSCFEEASSNVVNINDLSFEVMNEVLKFIYTGKVTYLDEERTFQLLYAAEKYDIENLKNLCIRYLSCHLTQKSAEKILWIADFYNLHELKQLASAKLL